jgi:integrase
MLTNPHPARNYLLSEWLAEALTLMSVKPSTLASYESLSRLLVRGLGDQSIQAIGTLDVQRFIVSSARTLSASRVRQSYIVLSKALGMAVAYGMLDTSPCISISLPRLPHREMRYLDLNEVRALASACGRHETLVLFLALTGLRWGEAAALRHGDIDGNKVYVRRAQLELAGRITYGTPKSHSQRTLYLPASLGLGSGSNSALVFTSSQGGPMRHGNFRQRTWLRATDAVGKSGLRVHDLRHTAVSLLIQAGVHPKVIRRLMGHSSVSITMDTYGHLIGNQLQQASHALDALWASSAALETDDDT